MTLSALAGIKPPHGRHVLPVSILILVIAGGWVWARSSASVPLAPTADLKVETGRLGDEFAPGAVGLATEARELSSGRLSAGHSSLVRLMALLGPSVLRIGGSSVDFSWWTSSAETPPEWAISTITPADFSALHGLLSATGWRVLLGVDLGHFEPARAADEARYAKEILGRSLLGIEIGNEPDGFSRQRAKLRSPTYNVDEYLHEAQAYRQALTAATPSVAVYGPAMSTSMSGIQWLTQVGTTARMFTELTQHYYPITTCPPITSSFPPQPTAAELLSPTIREEEDRVLDVLARAEAIAGRPTRIGETNSVACDGGHRASPAFAGALWSLDWALRAASDGVKGLSFHGTLDICSSFSDSPICAPDRKAAEAGDVTAQPEYYGLLAACQLEGGRFVPTRLIAPGPLPDLTTWATLTPGGTVQIAIDNLATTGLAQPVSIPAYGYTVTEEALVGHAIQASGGIVFAGASVSDEGQWHSKSARSLKAGHSVRIIVRPASAVIVTLRPKR